MLSTPYYFPAGQTELTAMSRNLLAELPLPLVLYNMPSLTKVWFELETLKKLAAARANRRHQGQQRRPGLLRAADEPAHSCGPIGRS